VLVIEQEGKAFENIKISQLKQLSMIYYFVCIAK
jgi:hypothetical protein